MGLQVGTAIGVILLTLLALSFASCTVGSISNESLGSGIVCAILTVVFVVWLKQKGQEGAEQLGYVKKSKSPSSK